MCPKKKTICALTASLLISLIFVLPAEDPVPISPLHVRGVVGFENRLDRGVSILYLNAAIQQGGVFVPGLVVKFQGQLADETSGPYNYGSTIHGVVPAVGETLSVTIQSKALAPHAHPPVLAATCAFTSLFHITAPANNGRIASTLPELVINWGGGASPYIVEVNRVTPPSKKVFQQAGIMRAQCRVPMRYLAAGCEYLVSLRSDDMGRFTFGGIVAAGSEIKLREMEVIRVFVD